MRSKMVVLMLLIAALAVPQAVAACPTTQNATTPGQLLKELGAALRSDPCKYYHWEKHYDSTFNSWTNGGSMNLPVVAAAIKLIRDSDKTAAVDWWNKFLTCQNTPGSCVVGQGNISYFKSTEITSNKYDFAVVASVVAVNWFAHADSRGSALQNLARSYLRKNWSIYALAAGRTWSETLLDDVDGTGAPSGNGCGEYSKKCNRTDNNLLFFTGPFLALAGTRSGPGSRACYDDRAVLFAYAVAWVDELGSTGGFKNLKEHADQASVRTYVQNNWPGNVYGENVYALNPNEQSLIRDHIFNANQTTTLVGVISGGGTRFVIPMRFFGWSDGTRLSTLGRHINNNPGGTVYALKFDPAIRRAHLHYPWYESKNGPYRSAYFGYSRTVTNTAPGFCGFPTALNAQLETWNDVPSGPCPDAPDCKHPTKTVWLPLPTSGKVYEVVIDSAGARRLF